MTFQRTELVVLSILIIALLAMLPREAFPRVWSYLRLLFTLQEINPVMISNCALLTSPKIHNLRCLHLYQRTYPWFQKGLSLIWNLVKPNARLLHQMLQVLLTD